MTASAASLARWAAFTANPPWVDVITHSLTASTKILRWTVFAIQPGTASATCSSMTTSVTSLHFESKIMLVVLTISSLSLCWAQIHTSSVSNHVGLRIACSISSSFIGCRFSLIVVALKVEVHMLHCLTRKSINYLRLCVTCWWWRWFLALVTEQALFLSLFSWNLVVTDLVTF